MTKTVQEAWNQLQEGNRRFIDGAPAHPNQGAARRATTAQAQAPIAALFGCSDSRLSAEIIFDVGLGDLFVVRNMGQIISPSVTASLEYAVDQLDVPLIVVLAHDSCGAIKAAINQAGPEPIPLPANIRTAIEKILPAVARVRNAAGLDDTHPVDVEAVSRAHLRDTMGELVASSEVVSEKIAAGKLAIIGATYTLEAGAVSADVIVGTL
jgi:carbonic anhydrase